MTKTCPKCNEIKDGEDYYKSKTSKTGLQVYCKKCQNELDAKASKRRKASGPTIIRQSKECQICHNKKPIGQFGIRRSSADGHLSYCKPCWIIYVKKAQAKAKIR